MKARTIAVATLVLVAGVGPLVAAGDATEARAYSGTHVSFAADGGAMTNYSVEGETVATSVRVQSAAEVEGSLDVGVDADLAAVTDFAGASLSVDARTQANATVRAESGATLRAHDHDHGTLVVSAGEKSQYVSLGLNASSEVRAESDQRAVVTTDDGTEVAVLVSGEGSVTVNDEGNLTAKVESESKLVVRAYDDRSAADRREERLIVEGQAAAEVYVDEQGGETVTGSVTYDANTSVAVHHESEGHVEATVDRSEHDGEVVLLTGVDAESDLSVRVDGEAAARASSYSELRAAAEGGSTSKYVVRGSADAEATVLVAVNHFSERRITVTEADDGTSGDSTTDSGSDAGDSDADTGNSDADADGSTTEAGDTPADDPAANDGNDGSDEGSDATTAGDGSDEGSDATTAGDDGGMAGGAGPGFGVAMVVSGILSLFGLATLRDDPGE